MAKTPAQLIPQQLRQEPHFEPKPTDYGPADVRAVANLEEEIGKLAATEFPKAQPSFAQPRTRDIGNSSDMKRVQQIVNNSVTAAHEDTCKAIDKIVDECEALAARARKAADAHKAALRSDGQIIAVKLEATLQELTRTVEWLEQQGPKLREPELELPNPLPAAEAKE